MAEKTVNTDLNFGGTGRVRGIAAPALPGDAVNKTYADGLVGATAIKTTEIDYGAVPVIEKTFVVTDAAVSAANKILVQQSGKGATGRDDDENEMDVIHCRAVPGTGQFTLYTTCLTGKVSGKYLINYQLGV